MHMHCSSSSCIVVVVLSGMKWKWVMGFHWFPLQFKCQCTRGSLEASIKCLPSGHPLARAPHISAGRWLYIMIRFFILVSAGTTTWGFSIFKKERNLQRQKEMEWQQTFFSLSSSLPSLSSWGNACHFSCPHFVSENRRERKRGEGLENG